MQQAAGYLAGTEPRGDTDDLDTEEVVEDALDDFGSDDDDTATSPASDTDVQPPG